MVTAAINRLVYYEKMPGLKSLTLLTYKEDRGDGTVCGNYRGPKLLEFIMKIVEHILEKIICKQVDIDDMKFGFVPR